MDLIFYRPKYRQKSALGSGPYNACVENCGSKVHTKQGLSLATFDIDDSNNGIA
jgi:hypothetical protein